MLSPQDRKDCYALLVQLFSYPDPELLATLAGDRPATLVGLFPAVGPFPDDADLQLTTLETAFTALFVNRLGGAVAPPYGSVYLDPEGQLMGPSAIRVASCYAEEGLRLDDSPEPPDYLPTELEFLYFLVETEAAALARKDVAAARQATQRQARFVRELFAPWIEPFCARLAAEADVHPLYRWCARFLAAFCQQEADWLQRLHPA